MIGDVVYIWQEGNADGWGVIVAEIPQLDLYGPLLYRAGAPPMVGDLMRQIAVLHGEREGKVVRLAVMRLDAIAETVRP